MPGLGGGFFYRYVRGFEGREREIMCTAFLSQGSIGFLMQGMEYRNGFFFLFFQDLSIYSSCIVFVVDTCMNC